MDREEGELTDEDDLEDVSDSSSLSMVPIPLLMSGKSPLSSNRAPFRELSLTSVSDDSEEINAAYSLVNRDINLKKKYRTDHTKYVGIKRIRKISNKRIVRSRTSSFHKHYSNVSSSSEESDYKQDKKILKQLSDAVRINRSQHLPNCSLRTRLKRMIQSEFQPSKSNNSEDDAELETLRKQALHSKSKKEDNLNSPQTNNNANVTDADLIELRLIALQSAVLKKHQNRRKQKEEQQQKLEAQAQQENNSNSTEVDKQNITNNNTHVEDKANPKTDLDEDEDILRAMLLTSISKKIANKKNSEPSKSSINLKNVTSFKNSIKIAPMPINRLIINVNSSDSDSDYDSTVIENKHQKNIEKDKDVFDKNLSLFLQQAREKSDVEHQRAISHLPHSQQLEYKILKRKLQQLTNRINPSAKTKKPNDDKQFIKKVDRLQIKRKYEELVPLMTRVSDARTARDKAQTKVTRLINELRIARSQLTSTHQTYTTLIQELVQEKSKIDKRLDEELEITNLSPAVCTSTPKKVNSSEIQCELNVIEPNFQTDINSVTEEKPAEIENCRKNTQETEEIMDVVDDKKLENEPSFLNYSSPLDHIQLNRDQPDQNALLVLCPYDLLGVCRDADCSFRHCNNASTD